MLIFSNENELDGLFLIFLGMMANFTYNLLSCPMQDFLNNSIISRHIIFLLVVTFGTTFLLDETSNPMYHFVKAFFIYVFLIISTKMDISLSIIIFLLFVILYVVHMYIKYFNTKYNTVSKSEEKVKYKNLVDNLNLTNNIIIITILFITLYGFIKFTTTKRNKYGKKFDFSKFLFGIRKCKFKGKYA